MSRAQTVKRIADKLWDEVSASVDWRFRNGGGVAFVHLDAKTVLQWCETMGWEPPEGTEEHASKNE